MGVCEMKKKLLSFILVLALFECMIPITAGAVRVSDFTDVKPETWYYDAVNYAAENGLFSGTSPTTFSPDSAMTRGMFVTVLGKKAGVLATYGTNKTAPFNDVTQADYYFPYAAWSKDRSIISGVGNNLFAPGQSITREQMATIFYRFAEVSGYDMTYTDNSYMAFSDTSKVSSYAVIPLKWVTSQGVLNGSGGKLNPKGTATRAQVAQIFLNFSKVSDGSKNPDTEEPENSDSNWWEDYNPEYTRVTGKSAVDAQGGYYDYDLSNEIMDLINDLRRQNDLNELAYHPQIQEWASIRAKELEYAYISATDEVTSAIAHTRPDGTSCFTIQGNVSVLSSENALYSPNYAKRIDDMDNYASDLVASWYNSSGHKWAMLKNVSKHAAVACYVKNGNVYIIHLFSDLGVYRIDLSLGWI